MAALDDLNNNITALTSAIDVAVQSQGNSVPAADVETAATNIAAQTARLTTAFPPPAS